MTRIFFVDIVDVEVMLLADLGVLRKIHPELQSLEEWMREVGYDGTGKPLLKGFIDNGIGPGFEKK